MKKPIRCKIRFHKWHYRDKNKLTRECPLCGEVEYLAQAMCYCCGDEYFTYINATKFKKSTGVDIDSEEGKRYLKAAD